LWSFELSPETLSYIKKNDDNDILTIFDLLPVFRMHPDGWLEFFHDEKN